jgi:hypothetical protein
MSGAAGILPRSTIVTTFVSNRGHDVCHKSVHTNILIWFNPIPIERSDDAGLDPDPEGPS